MKVYHTILQNKLKETFPFLQIAALEDFVRQWTIHKKLNRFDLLSIYGKVERNLYFILEGNFHLYYPMETNYTVSLGISDMFYNSFESFVTQQPSKVAIQALCKSEVIGISRELFYQTVSNNWNYERAYRLRTESQLLERFERDYLLKLPSTERVQQFLNTRSDFFQHIPQKYIASYLNLTPETFSRILNKIKT